jgi:hypothetical protein
MADIAEEIVCNVREELLDLNLPLRIGSIFIIVVVSILGSLSPVIYASFGAGAKSLSKQPLGSSFILRLGL